MYCLSTKDGSKVWTYETNGMIKSTACVIHDALVFGSYDKMLHCVALETGELRFRSPPFNGNITTEAIPVYEDQSCVIVTSLSGEVGLVEMSGGTILKKRQFDGPFFSTPVSKEDLVIVATGT